MEKIEWVATSYHYFTFKKKDNLIQLLYYV